MRLSGTFVAMATPMHDDAVSEQGVRDTVRFQVESGTDGLLPLGTTGESPTLTADEKRCIIETVIDENKGRALVVVGTGTNDTAKTIAATRQAKELHADAALVITPYYNKPTQEGLFRHFEAIAKAVELPIMIYNVPSRTGVNILPSTLERLAKIETIVAVKEASADLNQVSEIINRCGDNLQVLSGDDALFLPIMSVGGQGVVSVVGNIVPADLKALFTLFKNGEQSRARERHNRLFPLCQAMFYETNPVPVKTAMNLLGMQVGGCRLPLVEMSHGNRDRLIQALRSYGLLSDRN